MDVIATIAGLFSGNFLFWDDVPETAEHGVYKPLFVVLSYVIATLGSFSGLRLAVDIYNAQTERWRSILHVCGALAFGTGIWAMHFIGMLAYKMEMAVSYHAGLTALSMLVAVVIAYGFLAVVRWGFHLRAAGLFAGAVLLGAAICVMHYTGMTAMQMDADLYYTPGLFFLSLLIAIGASAAALLIVFKLGRYEGRNPVLWQILAAAVMGAAICGMHYTGMEAAVFIPWADCRYDPDQSFAVLGATVFIISTAVFAVALTLGFYRNAMDPDMLFTGWASSGRAIFWQLCALLSIFLLLLVGSFVFVGDNLRNYAQDGRVLNAVSLQRMLMTSYGGQVSAAAYAHAQNDLQRAAAYTETAHQQEAWINANFNAFLEGGEIIYSADASAKTDMSGFERETVRVAIGEALSQWMELRDFAAEILDSMPDTGNADKQAQLNILTAAAVTAQDRAVGILQERLERQNSEAYHKNRVVLIVGSILFLLTILYARFFIVRPLEVSRTALDEHRNNLQDLIWDKTQDIVKTRDRLRGEKARLAAIMENMAQGVITMDKDEKILTVNRSAEKISGYREKELIGGSIEMLMSEEFIPLHRSGMDSFFRTGESPLIGRDIEMDGLRKDGTKTPVVFNATIVTIDGEPVFIVLIRDVAEQKQKELDLEAAKLRAEQASQAKSEFLAKMSHEFRTPLNSILGMIRILQDDDDLDKETLEMIEVVNRSASSLLDLVDDVLDVSKIEAGSLILEKYPFDFRKLLAEVVETLAPLASYKGLSLQYSYTQNDDEMPYLKGDPTRVMRILVNLISNAIKYTEEGRIDITVNYRYVTAALIELSCTVKDTGIGIQEEKQETIFEKFTQADETITRKYGGTGLGLAIIKELVELMDGIIGVKSKPGKGAEFWFTLPFEVAEHPEEEEEMQKKNASRQKQTKRRSTRRPAIEKAQMMIAEDHPLNQAFIRKFMQRLSVGNIVMVENGEQAVAAYQEDDAAFDIILMDCHMPEMDGYQAARAIRDFEKRTKKKKRVPIIALTADAMAGTREKCLEAGMDEYLTKPIDAQDMRDTLSAYIRLSEENDRGGAKQESGKTAKKAKETPPVDFSIPASYADTVEEMRELIDVFLEQAQQDIKQMAQYCTSGSNDDWAEMAHKMKGGAGAAGVYKMQALCAQAQKMQIATRDDRAAILKDIKSAFEEAKAYFRETVYQDGWEIPAA